MKSLLKAFATDERGVSAIQYALVAMLCSVSIIVMLYDMRQGVNRHLDDASQGMQDGNAR